MPGPRRLLLTSLLAFSLGVCALFAGFAYIQRLPESVAEGGLLDPGSWLDMVQSPGRRAFGQKGRLNVLCLGIDYNYNDQGILHTKGARSDTIFVVSLDSQGRTLNILSIPRDTQAYLGDDYGMDKINAAFAYGGVEKAREAVSEFLGVPIDHHVIIKVSAASKLVEALGGLPIDVEKEMDYDDNWGRLHIHLEKGPQVLSGDQAVGYARFRMDEEGDRGRIRRQQQVMEALVRRLKDPTVLLRLQPLVRAFKENLETDLGVMELLDLAYLYRDFDRKRMKAGTIVGDDADIDGISYIIPYAPEKERLVRALLLEPADLAQGDVRVEVLNASGDERAVGALVELLREQGFKVVRVADSERADLGYTRVVDHLGNPAVRAALESLLVGAAFERDPEAGTHQPVDITILVGRDRVAAPDQPDLPSLSGELKHVPAPTAPPLEGPAPSLEGVFEEPIPPEFIEEELVPMEAEPEEPEPEEPEPGELPQPLPSPAAPADRQGGPPALPAPGRPAPDEPSHPAPSVAPAPVPAPEPAAPPAALPAAPGPVPTAEPLAPPGSEEPAPEG